MLHALRSRSKRSISCDDDSLQGSTAKVSRAALPRSDAGDIDHTRNVDPDHHHLSLLDSSLVTVAPIVMAPVPAPDDIASGSPLDLRQSLAITLNAESSVPVRPPATRPRARPIRQLHYYQRFTIDQCLSALRSGSTTKRFAVSSPAGSGKTEMFVSLLPDIPDRGDADKVLILVPNLEILSQVRNLIRKRHRNKYEVDIEHGGNHPDDDSDADIIIATWQCLNDDQIRKYDPALFRCVIVDEAHHASATTYLRQLHYFNDEVKMRKALRPIQGLAHGHKVPIIGFSATLARGDRRPLNWVFDSVVANVSIKSLFDGNFLSPVQVVSMVEEVELLHEETLEAMYAKSETPEGTLNQFRRRYNRGRFARSQPFKDFVVSTYLDQARYRRSTLVFCPCKKTAAELTDDFNKANQGARYVDGSTPIALRQKTINDFKMGLFPVLVNCRVFTEGANMPAIDVVILASPTRSQNGVNQMLGRGTRLSPSTGKDSCLILDMFNILGRFGLGVEPCLWQEKAYEVPPIPKSWTTDSDEEGEDDGEDPADWADEGPLTTDK